MNQWLEGTRSLALRVANDAGSGLRNGLRGAARTAGQVTVVPQALRKGGRQVAHAVRRNPLTTATTVIAVLGAGVALWMLGRKRQQAERGPIEVPPVRMGKAPARRARSSSRAATKAVQRNQAH